MLVFVVGIIGCGAAPVVPPVTGMPVVALAGEHLFFGRAWPTRSGTGGIEVAGTNSDLACTGQFRYRRWPQGGGTLSCSDGSQGDFSLTALSVGAGHGLGESDLGPLSFAFGMAALDAARHLVPPPGQRVVVVEGRIGLIPDL